MGKFYEKYEKLINKQKHQMDKKVLRQDRSFSTRLPYASKKIRTIFSSTVNTLYISTDDMIDKLQQIKYISKLVFYQNISNYYDETN